MPYASVNDVPSNIPEGKRSQFRQVFNSVFADTKDEGKAMAAAYSAIKKAQYATDIFTTEGEAKARSMDMGLNGAIHVNTYDGQAVYMPAESQEAYLAYYLPEDEIEAPEGATEAPTEDRMEIMEYALTAVVEAIMEFVVEKKHKDAFKVIKIDNEQRIIYGWASVTTYKGELVVDLQGDVIKTDTLHKSINEFMKGVRVGKLNHSGEQVGQIVHSFPMSKEICAALEIQSEKEGWITGYHVTDDTLWEKVKAGDYAEFSIGGRAQKQEL